MLQVTYGWEASFIVPFGVFFVTEPGGRLRLRLPLRARFSILTITLSIRSRSPRSCSNIFSKSIRLYQRFAPRLGRFTQRGEGIGGRLMLQSASLWVEISNTLRELYHENERKRTYKN